MINKPKDVKNNYFITYLMELAQIYGTDAVSRQCDTYNYKVKFPKEITKDPINLRNLVDIENFDDDAYDLL